MLATASGPLLATSGLSKTFGGHAAVEDLDLTVAAGEVVALVGPNGCGKSTTLRLVTGLLTPDTGTVRVAGHPVGSPGARSVTALVPDSPKGFDDLTIGEFLALYRSLYGAPKTDFAARTTMLLEAFNLGDRRRALLRALSHGQRRQVSIIAAFGVRAPLLVVDEAAAALDPEAVIVLREALRASAAAGAAVLLATQDLHFAELSADRFVLLHRGCVLADGTAPELFDRFLPEARSTSRTLEQVFLASLGQTALVEELRDAFRAL